MPRLNDVSGMKFGRYTVICRSGSDKRGQATWLCRCECGREKVVRGYALRRGTAKSCGCLVVDTSRALHTTHGLVRDNLKAYRAWAAMKTRCYNQNFKSYPDYGGRGITVCASWINSFEQFFLDMGPPPDGLTLDRIDYNSGYSKSNCRWASQYQQQNNKRNNVRITLNGVTKSVRQWAEDLGIDESTIRWRIKNGWSTEAAVTTQKGGG